MSATTNYRIMKNMSSNRSVTRCAGIVADGRWRQFSYACKRCGKVVVVESDAARDFTGLCFDCLLKMH